MTNTLNTPVVAALVGRLFGAADASDVKIREVIGAMSPEERQRRMSDPNSDYRGFYGQVRDHYLAVSRETATLLYMLARTTKAKAIVEYGTSFGISTLHLAAALRDNGGGLLIGSEFEPGKVAKARANLTEAGLVDLVEIREGDALETLAKELPATIDVVLLDGHKPLYSRILDLVEPSLRAGSVLVADNVDACPDYVGRVRAAGGPYLSVPFAKDVELSIRL